MAEQGLNMINCYKCKIKLTKDNWNKGAVKKNDRICKDCSIKKSREWYLKNKERAITNQKENYKNNKENKLKYAKEYQEKNWSKHLEVCKKWNKNNKGKKNAATAKRRASKKQATPPWTTSIDLENIKLIYIQAAELTKKSGISYHVDHIEPLQGKNGCGLHVLWNLQIITAKENLTKGCKHGS